MTIEKSVEEIDDIEELIRIGKELAEKENYEQAIAFIGKALNKAPNDLNALNSMGFAYGRKGDYNEAIKHYKKAIELEPNHQKALGNIGHVYEMMKEYSLAIEFYERSLKANPTDDNLRFPENIITVVKDHLAKARELAEKQ